MHKMKVDGKLFKGVPGKVDEFAKDGHIGGTKLKADDFSKLGKHIKTGKLKY